MTTPKDAMTDYPWPVHPAAERLPLLADDALAALADDIDEHGLNEPVWLYDDPVRGVVLLDGRNRARACALAEVDVTQPEHVRWYEGRRPWAFVHSENRLRRHMTAGQSIAYITASWDDIQAERAEFDAWRQAEEDADRRRGEAAAERNRERGEAARAAADDVAEQDEVDHPECAPVHTPGDPQDEPEEEAKPHRAADDVADLAGVSARSVAQFKRIQEQAPDLVAQIESGEMSLAEADKVIRHRLQLARNAEIAAMRAAALPEDRRYCAVVIDPPWPMKKIERDVRPKQDAELDYPTMPVMCLQADQSHAHEGIDRIACHEVDEVEPCQSIECVVGRVLAESAYDDCHLYLWVTHKFLPAGLKLLDAWGFGYQCVMTWRKNVGITPFSWMYDTEHVLFATRGSLPLERKGLRLSFEALVQGHSIKPDVFYERVLEASPEPRLEMFARRARDGFDSWGNEVAEDVI